MKVQVKKVSEVQKLRFRISKQKELIDYYEQMSHTLGGSDYSRERVDCTRDLRAPFEKWIYKKIDAEEKLKEMESALTIKLEELANKIDQVDDAIDNVYVPFGGILANELRHRQAENHLCK